MKILKRQINIKSSAKITQMNEHTNKIKNAVITTWLLLKFPTPTITSGSEQVVGRLTNSKHYQHLALDFRVRDLPGNKFKNKYKAITYLRILLGNDYDVVDKVNHIHIEYDPEWINSSVKKFNT